MVDFLRSCYTTDMAVTVDGKRNTVDWYWVPETAPLMIRSRFGSLNWTKPRYGEGLVGEVIGARRPWRDGSLPVQVNKVNPENSTLGLSDWYLNGAPADWPFIMPITWYGARAYPGHFDVGIFPPKQTFFTATLTSNLHGSYPTWFPVSTGFGWQRPDPITLRPWLAWFKVPDDSPLFSCDPTWTMVAVRGSILTHPTVLKCTSQVGYISTWIDPSNTALEAGEILTLDATP